jgi:predicted DNA-binding transcriptional regulator YafY
VASTLRADPDSNGPQSAMMRSMADTSARLLRLLAVLAARPRWTAAELADRLQVTPRTVRRDVDRLRRLDYPVTSVPGPGGGYRLGAGGRLPPLVLDEAEAIAVAVCLRVGTSGSITGVEDAAARALGKLERTLPGRLRPPVDAVHRSTVALTGAAVPVEPHTLVLLARACGDGERVRLDYRTRDGHAGPRIVDPYRLVHAGWRWYLVARDVTRDGWRTLRLDRIDGVVPTGELSALTDPPDARALVSHAVSTAPYPVQATVRVHAPLADVADRVPPTVGVLRAEPDATTVLTTGAATPEQIAAHLVLLGFEFTVLDPPALCDTVRAVAATFARATGAARHEGDAAPDPPDVV